jgi:ribosomal protein S27E
MRRTRNFVSKGASITANPQIVFWQVAIKVTCQGCLSKELEKKRRSGGSAAPIPG